MREQETRARFDQMAERWQGETGLHSNPHFIM